MDSELVKIPHVIFDVRWPTIIITPFSVRATFSDWSSMNYKVWYKRSLEIIVERTGIGLYILGQWRPKCIGVMGIDLFGANPWAEFIQEKLINAIEFAEKVEKMKFDYYEWINKALNK